MRRNGSSTMINVENTDQRFYIDQSTIPKAGYGLFAEVTIEKGSLLNILGIVVIKNSLADLCTKYAESYKFSVTPLDENNQSNLKLIAVGYAALVNHSEQKRKRNVQIKYLEDGGLAYEFTKKVNPGQEILTDYGPNWRDICDI